jgi:hypothetical protein
MPNYLAVYVGSPAATSAWDSLSEGERQQRTTQALAAWHQWATDHAGSIVDMGGPLSKTKLVNKAGISDIRNNLGAFTVIRADSQEAAARLFVNHPHFTLFPGEGVEVMEILAIPGA